MTEEFSTVEIEELRSEINSKHRFKSSFNGFDKASVNQYICGLAVTFDEITAGLKSERDDLLVRCDQLGNQTDAMAAELTGLKEKLAKSDEKTQTLTEQLSQKELDIKSLQSQLEESRNQAEQLRELAGEAIELREKNGQMSAEISIMQSVIEESKAANELLTVENTRRGVKIAEMDEKLTVRENSMRQSASTMNALSAKTVDILGSKLRECEQLLAVWKNEHDGAVDIMRKNLEK